MPLPPIAGTATATLALVVVVGSGCGEAVHQRGGPNINAAYEELPSLDESSRGPPVACILIAVEELSPELQSDLKLNQLFFVHADFEQLRTDFFSLGLPQANIFSRIDAEATVKSVTELLDEVST
ncbi:MAG: hypothetical protein IIB09_00960, partial [Bacteroidetes bacterium]|nr:hypothetical protein [Bacteroidota bacterium]